MRPHCPLYLVMLVFSMFICLHTTETLQFYHTYRWVMKSYSLPWNGILGNPLSIMILIVLVLMCVLLQETCM
ncbi:hypothetical protein PVAP13_9KG634325 [Panicum virgatum]|uniref:Uncharacterized protein n=1 Tax=Panicum virgatum TaxID=38727 RepID=A0A8T0P196_PANVG|nr:hypothetical protein PVAP13_9KG634325 [Panicum virgatum]